MAQQRSISTMYLCPYIQTTGIYKCMFYFHTAHQYNTMQHNKISQHYYTYTFFYRYQKIVIYQAVDLDLCGMAAWQILVSDQERIRRILSIDIYRYKFYFINQYQMQKYIYIQYGRVSDIIERVPYQYYIYIYTYTTQYSSQTQTTTTTKMQAQQYIKKLVSDSKLNLISALKQLDEQTKKHNLQQSCTKLKIILGLISESNLTEIEKQVMEFNDPDLIQCVNGLKAKLETKRDNPIMNADKHSPKKTEIHKVVEPNKKVEKKEDKTKRSGSLLKTIVDRFVKHDQNVHQMILPDKEPKSYYDPVKKMYVIEGEAPQPEKEIPKPPPKKTTTNTAKQPKLKEKGSEIDQMMAPPAFKRKGVNKKKQQVIVKPKQNPITFQSLQQKIFAELDQIAEKAIGTLEQQLHLQIKAISVPKPSISPQSILMLRQFSDEIRTAQQISDTMLTRLHSSYIDSEFDSEHINGMLEQMLQFEKTNTKFLDSLLQEKSKQNKNMGMNLDSEEFKRVHYQLTRYQQEIQLLKLENEKFKSKFETADKNLLDQREKYRLNLHSEISQNKMIKQSIEEKKKQIEVFQKQRQLKHEQMIGLKNQLAARKDQIRNLKNDLKAQKQKLSHFESSIHNEQQSILKALIKNESLSSLLHDVADATIAENELLLAIQSKRMSICTQGKQPSTTSQEIQSYQNSASLLELSDTFSKVIHHYQSQMQSLKQESINWSDKYQTLRSELNRNQQNLAAENQSLQRSLARLKSLLQDSKQQCEETEIKISQVQNQNQSLLRQIAHLRKQHSYTKQVLQQNIRSQHDNTATLKQQLQAEIKELQQKIQEKQINERVLQQEIKEVSEQIQNLIKDNKSKGMKVAAVQKDMKQFMLDYTEMQQKLQALQSKLDEAQRQKQSVQNKLQQQKNKNQSMVRNHKLKIKDIGQQANQTKMHVRDLKKENQQMRLRVEELVRENDEIMRILEKSNQQNQQIKEQLKTKLEDDQQNQQLNTRLLQYQQYAQDLQTQTETLTSHLSTSHQTITQLQQQLQTYKSMHNDHTAQTQSLLLKLAATKEQIQTSSHQFIGKIEQLMNMLNQNQRETQNLTGIVGQYQKLSQAMNRKIEALEGDIVVSRQQNDRKDQEVYKLINQVQRLNKIISNMESREQQLIKQNTKPQQNTQQNQQKLKLEYQSQLQALQDERDSFEQITFQMERQTATLFAQIDGLKQKLSAKINENQQLLSLCSHKQKEIGILSGKVADHGQQEELNRSWEIKIEEVVNQKNVQILKRDQKIGQIQKQIEDITKDMEQKDLIIVAMQQKLQQNTRQLLSKQNQIKQKQHKLQTTINTLLHEMEKQEQQFSKQLTKQREISSKLLKQLKQRSSQKSIRQELQLQSQYSHSSQEQSEHNQSNGNSNNGNKPPSNNLSAKNKLINNIQFTKDELDRLNRQINAKDREIDELKKSVDEKNKDIETVLLQLEEKQRQIGQLTQTIRKNMEAPTQQQHQQQIIKSSESLTQQQHELQQLALAQQATINEQIAELKKQSQQIQKINDQLNMLKEENIKLKKEKSQLHQLYVHKSEQAETTIERLEGQLRDSKKFSDQIIQLERKVKDLQLENGELLEEKLDLLKTKNQISAKLAQRSQVNISRQTESKQNGNSNTSKAAVNGQPKQKKPEQQPQKQSGGLFGSLSSLFLTETENSKLAKTRK